MYTNIINCIYIYNLFLLSVSENASLMIEKNTEITHNYTTLITTCDIISTYA